MPPQDLERKLTAILSADVAGYSLLMRDNQEVTTHALTDFAFTLSNRIEGMSQISPP